MRLNFFLQIYVDSHATRRRKQSSFPGGGLAAVIYIDVVQVLIMVAGSSVLLFKGLGEVGGWAGLQEK